MSTFSGTAKTASSNITHSTVMRVTIFPICLGQSRFVLFKREWLLIESLHSQKYPALGINYTVTMTMSFNSRASILFRPTMWTGLNEAILDLVYVVILCQNLLLKNQPALGENASWTLGFCFFFCILWHQPTILNSSTWQHICWFWDAPSLEFETIGCHFAQLFQISCNITYRLRAIN